MAKTMSSYVQDKMPDRISFAIPYLRDIPLVGPALFRHHPFVCLTVIFTFVLVWFPNRTRSALILRSVGESPTSAHALGCPVRVLLGAYLFGGVTMLQFYFQASGVEITSQLLSSLPYLATILVLVLISCNPQWIKINMPALIGNPFYPGS